VEVAHGDTAGHLRELKREVSRGTNRADHAIHLEAGLLHVKLLSMEKVTRDLVTIYRKLHSQTATT
jgi:hypothetical protein